MYLLLYSVYGQSPNLEVPRIFLIMLYVNIRQHVVLSILHIFSEIEISYMYHFFCWWEEQGCNGLQKTIDP